MNVGRGLARLTIGGLFIGHGMQKLFGWFEGPGPAVALLALPGFATGRMKKAMPPTGGG
jgi:hypothetical protein